MDAGSSEGVKRDLRHMSKRSARRLPMPIDNSRCALTQRQGYAFIDYRENVFLRDLEMLQPFYHCGCLGGSSRAASIAGLLREDRGAGFAAALTRRIPNGCNHG
jgi:hypothetical protein